MSKYRLSTISPIPALKILQSFISVVLSSVPLPYFNNLLSKVFLACLTLTSAIPNNIVGQDHGEDVTTR